ncbi:MAG: hypothetical protein GX465_17640 [Acidobacteria bacterium]|nr:hypothetical protein [Acidobacteriota bacterium]
MTEPTWQMLLQLGALGPIVWLLYRMLPVLAKVGEAFTRLEVRVDTHCQEQKDAINQHEQRAEASWDEQRRWNAEMLRRINGTKGEPAQGH